MQVSTGRRALSGALVATFLSWGLAAPVAASDTFPSRPIKIIVPYAAGGAVDGTARMLANELKDIAGQPVVVENRGGASGMIGVDALVRSPADGHTVLIDTSAISMNPSIFKKPLYTPKDVAPVAQIMRMPFLIAVTPALGVTGLEGLLAAMKADPDRFNGASSGTSSRLFGELFRLQAGVTFTHVGYPGAAPAMMSVMKNETQLIAMDLANISSFIKSGQLNGVVVSGSERAASLPDVPHAVEAGLPGYDVHTWFGIFAPAATPPAVVEKLNGYIRQAIQRPAVQAFIRARDAVPVDESAASFSAFFEQELTRWKGVMADAGIQAE